jgi:predicted small lipoprotein YifL
LSPFTERRLLRIALLAVLAASFALAGCGRKGSLDPPPASAVAGGPADGAPAAPARREPDRRILLDYLLN